MAKVDLTEDEVYSRLRSVSNSKGNGIYDALRSADIPWDFLLLLFCFVLFAQKQN